MLFSCQASHQRYRLCRRIGGSRILEAMHRSHIAINGPSATCQAPPPPDSNSPMPMACDQHRTSCSCLQEGRSFLVLPLGFYVPKRAIRPSPCSSARVAGILMPGA